MRFIFLVLVAALLAACAPSLDVGRPIDIRSITTGLEEGLSSRADVLEVIGWPDNCVAVDTSRWRYGDPAAGLPAGTASVWSYHRVRVASRWNLAPGAFQMTSLLLRFYFSADGTLLGWDQQGTGGPLPPYSLRDWVNRKLAALPRF